MEGRRPLSVIGAIARMADGNALPVRRNTARSLGSHTSHLESLDVKRVARPFAGRPHLVQRLHHTRIYPL